MAGGAAAAAAAAAQAARRAQQIEEETMVYGSDDLSQDWEFKIVRSNTMAFRKPARLRRLLDEESRSGWIMLEKFDNNRIRFKRPRQARLNDAALPPGVDPYRTQVGLSPGTFTAILTLALLAVVGGLMTWIAYLTK